MTDKELIIKMHTKENAGIGRIFRTLRKRSGLNTTGDFPLFKRIILTLKKEGFSIPCHQIKGHFKNIGLDDYAQSEKRELLKDLKRVSSPRVDSEVPQESSKTGKKSPTIEVYAEIEGLYPSKFTQPYLAKYPLLHTIENNG